MSFKFNQCTHKINEDIFCYETESTELNDDLYAFALLVLCNSSH